MTVDMVARFMPFLPGYIARNYRWVERRYGECIYSVADLQQLAMISLIQASRRWEKPKDITDPDIEERMFFGYLKTFVKNDVLRSIEDRKSPEQGLTEPVWDEEGEERTSLRIFIDPSMMQNELVDYFDSLSERMRLTLAVRYFDELELREMAPLFRSEEASLAGYVSGCVARYRQHARNQYLEYPEPLEHHRTLPWEPPEELVSYIAARWQADIPAYLAYVSAAFRADVTYLVDILGQVRKSKPRAESPEAAALRDRVERLSQLGWSQQKIATELGTNQSRVQRMLARRVA